MAEPIVRRSGIHNMQFGHNVTIGSNVTILPVKICSGAVIGAGAVVTKDITTPGTYIGNPATLSRAFV